MGGVIDGEQGEVDGGTVVKFILQVNKEGRAGVAVTSDGWSVVINDTFAIAVLTIVANVGGNHSWVEM